MTHDKVLLGKVFISVVAALVCVIGANGRIQALPRKNYFLLSFCYLLVSRLFVFLLIYVGLHEHAQSDVPSSYYPQARDVIHGLLPYKDFTSSYAPLFPYIVSLAVRVRDSPLAIVGLAIAFELIAFPIWVAFAQRVSSQRIARLAILFYVTSPIALVNVAIDGQNQVWISCFLAVALLLTVSGRPLMAGGALALPIAVVKFLPAIVAPAFLIRPRQRGVFLVGFIAVLLSVYGVFVLLGADVLSPLRSESTDHTSGNVPYLLSILLPHPNAGHIPRFENVVTTLCVFAIYGLAWLRTRTISSPDYESRLVVLFLLTLMLVSKKSYTNYIEMILFPLCLVVAGGRINSVRIGLFSLFGALVVLEPSLWFRWMAGRGLREALQTSSGLTDRAKIAAFVVCEVLLVGLYAYYWWQTWKSVRTAEHLRETTADGSWESSPLTAPAHPGAR